MSKLQSRALARVLSPEFPKSIDSEPVKRVPGRHVGEDHAITDLQAILNLDGVDRRAAQPHLNPNRFAVGQPFKHGYCAIGLAIGWTADVKHVGEAFDLDRAVHAQVRPNSFWIFAIQL